MRVCIRVFTGLSVYRVVSGTNQFAGGSSGKKAVAAAIRSGATVETQHTCEWCVQAQYRSVGTVYMFVWLMRLDCFFFLMGA